MVIDDNWFTQEEPTREKTDAQFLSLISKYQLTKEETCCI
jgi:hypothetical protein